MTALVIAGFVLIILFILRKSIGLAVQSLGFETELLNKQHLVSLKRRTMNVEKELNALQADVSDKDKQTFADIRREFRESA